nr:MAG TPA: hypothetical protein [Bacteriophage sp.]
MLHKNKNNCDIGLSSTSIFDLKVYCMIIFL